MTRIVWTAEEGLQPSEAVVVGTLPNGESCLYVVRVDGTAEISEPDTDGDRNGAGWPFPPRHIVREAQRLAAGSLAIDI